MAREEPWVAYHEAGHAIVGHYSPIRALKFKSISLSRTATSRARVEWEKSTCTRPTPETGQVIEVASQMAAKLGSSTLPDWRTELPEEIEPGLATYVGEALSWMMVALAGREAAKMVGHEPTGDETTGDLEDYDRLMRSLGFDGREPEAARIAKDCEKATHRILEAHWAEVSALARALIENDLTASQALLILASMPAC